MRVTRQTCGIISQFWETALVILQNWN